MYLQKKNLLPKLTTTALLQKSLLQSLKKWMSQAPFHFVNPFFQSDVAGLCPLSRYNLNNRCKGNIFSKFGKIQFMQNKVGIYLTLNFDIGIFCKVAFHSTCFRVVFWMRMDFFDSLKLKNGDNCCKDMEILSFRHLMK